MIDDAPPATPPTRRSWTRYAAVAIVVGVAWLMVYGLFTLVYPDDLGKASAYRYRDDALITLSHARGLDEIGTVSSG